MYTYLDDAYSMIADEERRRSCVITDPHQYDHPVVHISRDFERQTGYGAEDAIGRNARFLQGPGTDMGAVAAISEALAHQQAFTIDLLNYRKDGTPFWNRLRVRPVCGDDGTLSHYVGVQNPFAASDVRCELIPEIVS